MLNMWELVDMTIVVDVSYSVSGRIKGLNPNFPPTNGFICYTDGSVNYTGSGAGIFIYAHFK